MQHGGSDAASSAPSPFQAATASETPQPRQQQSAVNEGGGERGAAGTSSNGTETYAPTVAIDNEADFYSTLVTVSCRDRQGLLSDITAALNGLGIRVNKAVATTKEGNAADRFYVTRDGTKLGDGDAEEVHTTVFPVIGRDGLCCPIEQTIERRLPEQREAAKYWDEDTGVRVFVDNHASMFHTTVTVNAPDRPNLVTDVVQLLKDLELNISFASISTYADLNNFRHDVFHVTAMNGDKVDEATRQNITNAVYFMLAAPDTEEHSY